MSDEENQYTLELNLLENGIDFILTGIDELFDDTHVLKGDSDPVSVPAKSYKYGCLHLFSGFLLLLKERLRRHREELIFKGKFGDVKQKLNSGSKPPNTIDLDEALERLEIGPCFAFLDDELATIRKMQDYRNQFEHYKVAANKHQLWNTITAFLALIDKFLDQELQIYIEHSADTQELRDKIQTIESVWKRDNERKKLALQRKLWSLKIRFKYDRKKTLAQLNRLRKKGNIVFAECPECGLEKLIVCGQYKGICSNRYCRGRFPMATCNRCGKLMVGYYPWESNICASCQSEIMGEVESSTQAAIVVRESVNK